MQTRINGEGELIQEQVMGYSKNYTRLLFSYPSDGLKIYGFMDIPRGGGTFPVIIALHGYINPAIYNTLDYSHYYADKLADAGFLVIHPNLRNYRPSDNGPNILNTGYTTDVLNLISLVRKEAGQVGLIQKGDASKIGLWGHSMGGGIILRVLTLDAQIKAAVLYAPVSGDLLKSSRRFSLGAGINLPNTWQNDLQLISPSSHYDLIQASVSVHHGEADVRVPAEWSRELCQQLEDLDKLHECFFYPGQGHTFEGDGEKLFMQRSVDFYNRTLR